MPLSLVSSLTGLDSIALLHTNSNIYSCLVESNSVKLETRHKMILATYEVSECSLFARLAVVDYQLDYSVHSSAPIIIIHKSYKLFSRYFLPLNLPLLFAQFKKSLTRHLIFLESEILQNSDN